MNKPVILTLCSTIAPGEKVPPRQGHVWLKIEREGQEPESFGLFLPRALMPRQSFEHPLAANNGYKGLGTDVQRNIELGPKHERYYPENTTMRWALSPEKASELMRHIEEPQKYSQRDNNCAAWACGLVSKVIGVAFSPLETFADVDGKPVMLKDAPADAPRMRVSTPRRLPLALIKPAFHGAAVDTGMDHRNPPPMSVRLLPNLPAEEGGGTKLRILLATPFLAGLAAQAVSAKSVLQS